MTSAEVASQDPGSARKLGVNGDVNRKVSFKCGGPGNRVSGPRSNRRSASVQALTTKFNLMSSQPIPGKRTTRVVVGKPKKFAKPEVNAVLIKPIVPKRNFLPQGKTAPTIVVNGRDVPKVVENNLQDNVKDSIDKCDSVICVPSFAEKPNAGLGSKFILKPRIKAQNTVPNLSTEDIKVNDKKDKEASNDCISQTPSEPISETSCLPVRTAIGIFEASAVNKAPARPVAAVRPILKTVDEKSKPKLSPRDSLSRVRYKILRRTRGKDSDDEDVDHCEDKEGKSQRSKSVNIDSLSMKIKSEDILSKKFSIVKRSKNMQLFDENEEGFESNDNRMDRSKSLLISMESVNVKTVNVSNEDTQLDANSHLLLGSNVTKSEIELRRRLDGEKFEAVRKRLEEENIIVLNNNKNKVQLENNKENEQNNARDKLDEIFGKISQSTVPARYARRATESSCERYEHMTTENAQTAQDSSLFRKISESQILVTSASHQSARKFATLLKKKSEPEFSKREEVDAPQIDSVAKNSTDKENLFREATCAGNVGNDNSLRREVEKLFEEAVKSTDVEGKIETKPVTNNESSAESKIYEYRKPNSSFLWSKSHEDLKPLPSKPTQETEQKVQPSPAMNNAPLPKSQHSPGMGNIPLPKPPESFIPDCSYDRVGCRDSYHSDDGTEYDDISLSGREDNTYDAIGEIPPPETSHNESLYCVSERLDLLNVYEDIATLRANVEEYRKGLETEECYEEVEGDHGEGCYESIYGGMNGLVVLRSDSSDKSSFEKINSLYGGLPTQNPADGVESEVSSDYQKSPRTAAEDTESSSGSSHDTTTSSDDWIEVSDSEPEMSPHHMNRRSKRQKGGVSRPRANWSELQKRTNEKSAQEEASALANDEHVYESIPQSETAVSDVSPPFEHSATNQKIGSPNLADDSSDIDDFSSDEDCPDAQLPAEPTQQYKITQSLRAAGKLLRQNLTLRKSDFSKSLKKFRLKTDPVESPESGSKFYCELSAAAAGKGSGRPSGPPPPPPASDAPVGSGVQYADVRVNGSELYAECGLFKQRLKSNQGSRSSWYTEAGLYGINGSSPTEGNKMKPLFIDEPLYQFYTECVNAQERNDILQNYDSDGYEAINNYYSLINEKRCTLDVKVPMPNLEDFNDPPSAPKSFPALNRTLWCEVPEVETSCIVATLTEQQRNLQEAKFEIVTSEGSYIHSLTVLETTFMPSLSLHLTSREQRMLFSNILAVKAVSMRLMASLESCWNESIMLSSICDVILRHAQEDFHVYVKFCKHSTTVYRTLKTLTDTNPGFASALKQSESSAACHGLSLNSFLLLPMQRITRLPLLLGQVLTRLSKDDSEYQSCQAAFQLLNKIVRECNEEATRMEKTEEMLILSQQLMFPKAVRPLPIISANRCLIKRGTATLLLGKEDSKLTFGRRVSKSELQLLLFTDLLVLARPVKGRGLRVLDYCPRNLVHIQPAPPVSYLPPSAQNNLVLLTLLENYENKTAEMLLSLPSESDISRWQDSVSPVRSENPLESVYESWDCPQVIVIYEYTAPQPDELSLCIGDVVNVLKKIPDGWYQGERLRDGVIGWFPSNHTQEISSAHVRAKNKKQRYQFLAMLPNSVQTSKIPTSPS